MDTAIIYTLVSVILVSVVSLIGIVTISWSTRFLRMCVSFLVALAIGALLGDAFIHLIPEALAEAENPDMVPLYVLAGILIFFIIEKVFRWHHGVHGEGEHVEEHCDIDDPACDPATKQIKPLGNLLLISDGVHNFLDGLVIGAAYLVSIEVGIATTLAVILHEIPQEIADFGVLIHAGFTKLRALIFNFISALFAVLGAIASLVIGGAIESIIVFILPIAAGSFIYIASSDLTPELHKSKTTSSTIVQILAIILGIAAMWLLIFFEA